MATTTQPRGRQQQSTEEVMRNFDRRTLATDDPENEDLGLLALEIIMYDPELAKQLVRAGVDKMLKESPVPSG